MFFMDIISRMTFGEKTPPRPEVLTWLTDMVIGKRDASGALKGMIDRTDSSGTPTVKSFLLQLLLQCE